MRIGVFVGASTADLMSLDELVGRIKQAEDDGFDSFWVPHISARGYDALTVLALAGMQTSRIELGVGVVNPFTRNPALLAMAAATLDRISGGRFILGLGRSDRPVIEGRMGIPYDGSLSALEEAVVLVRRLLSGDEKVKDCAGRSVIAKDVSLATRDRLSEETEVRLYSSAPPLCSSWCPTNITGIV